MAAADDGRRAAEHEGRHDDREDGEEDEAEARRVDERAQHEDARGAGRRSPAPSRSRRVRCSTHAAHHTCPATARHGCRCRSAPGAATAARSGARAVCASAHSRSSTSGRRPRAGAVQQRAAANASASAATVTACDPRAHARQVGRDGAPAQPRVLEDPVGQAGVVERLDLERDDADVGARISRAAASSSCAPEPDEVRVLAAGGEVGVVAALVLVPLADEQQHEPVAERARRPRAAAPSRCASRGGRARWRRRRRPGRAPGSGRRRAAR